MWGAFRSIYASVVACALIQVWLRAERGVVGGNPVPGRGFAVIAGESGVSGGCEYSYGGVLL